MTKLAKSAPKLGFAVAFALAATAIAGPALAQAGNVAPLAQAPGLAVANLEAVVANSNAYKVAQTQRATTYKAQIDQATARRNAVAAQLQPLIDKFNKDRAANVPEATLRQEAASIQQIQQSAEQELQSTLQPVALSEAYAQEQINDKLAGAVNAAMAKQRISLLLAPNNVIAANNAYNLNQAILTELNATLPSVGIVPPAGWLPREQREQQAAAAQQAPATRAPANTKAPVGR